MRRGPFQLVYAAGLCVGIAVTVITNRGEILREIQYFIDKKLFNNSRSRIEASTRDENGDILLRELDMEGNVIREHKMKVDPYKRSLIKQDPTKKGNFNMTLTEESKSRLASVKPGMNSWELCAERQVKHKSRLKHFRNKVKNKIYSSSSSDVSSRGYFGSTSSLSTYNNDDDDLYDMPKSIVETKSRTDSLRSPSLCLTQSKNSSQSELPASSYEETNELYEMPEHVVSVKSQSIELRPLSSHQFPANSSHLELQSIASSVSHRCDSISMGSLYTIPSHTTSYSSNNDFLEYERQLREHDRGFHNLNTIMAPRAKSNRLNYDTQSTRSSTQPSLSFSMTKSLDTEDSWQDSTEISTIETPGTSEVSTLDGDSIIYLCDEDYASVRGHSFAPIIDSRRL